MPGRAELSLALDREALPQRRARSGQVAACCACMSTARSWPMMRDKRREARAARARHSAQPRRRADIALLDDPIALPGGRQPHAGRALVSRGDAQGQGHHPSLQPARAITVEADLDKDVNDTLAANRRRCAAEWEKVRARVSQHRSRFLRRARRHPGILDAMGPLFLLGVGLIYLILAAQFRSYWQPLMILVTVPLAFTGVAWACWPAGNPLSLYTLYGVIALTGIAVNSAIVLIDAANERLAAGMSVLHAAIYAARRRVVPIIITTGTTIGGLFSLAAGIGGNRCCGVRSRRHRVGAGVATVLTLFVVPVLYQFVAFRADAVDGRFDAGIEQFDDHDQQQATDQHRPLDRDCGPATAPTAPAARTAVTLPGGTLPRCARPPSAPPRNSRWH
jgi:multidrug efflux pump subunit AcrB